MNILRRLRWLWRVQGPQAVIFAIRNKLLPSRARSFNQFKKAIQGARGLEIGGASSLFSAGGLFPAYPLVSSLDNCNFSEQTLWEGTIKEGPTFRFDDDHEPGQQYITEATDLGRILTGTYDFLLSSHTLEHTANPILALSEWNRVLKPGGLLVLIVPHRDGTFDHRRPVTTMAHLLQDFSNHTSEGDQTHVPEILDLHDFEADPNASSRDILVDMLRDNLRNRCVHHHVFTTPLLIELVAFTGVQIRAVEPIRPFHILLIAEKLADGTKAANESFTTSKEAYLQSPFPSDFI